MQAKTFNYKLLLLGEGAVGKTSLILQYVEKTFTTDYKITLGADFKSKTVVLEDIPTKGEKITANLQIWDMAGKAKLSSFKKYYYPGTAGAILVFDTTRRETLAELLNWNEDVEKYSPGTVKYLIGNKIDLTDEIQVHEREREQYETIMGAAGSIETSAKTGENVEEVFKTISRLIIERDMN